MKQLSRFVAGAVLAVASSVVFAADIVDTAISAGQFKTLEPISKSFQEHRDRGELHETQEV